MQANKLLFFFFVQRKGKEKNNTAHTRTLVYIQSNIYTWFAQCKTNNNKEKEINYFIRTWKCFCFILFFFCFIILLFGKIKQFFFYLNCNNSLWCSRHITLNNQLTVFKFDILFSLHSNAENQLSTFNILIDLFTWIFLPEKIWCANIVWKFN